MSKRLNVVIVDDERNRTKKWAETLRASARDHIRDISLLEGGDLKTAVTILRDRQKNARLGRAIPEASSVFDSADLLIVDYDLLSVDQVGIETGESIAYLVRCYSRCGLIITLNQFGDNSFDLNLDPRFDSFADINIGSRQLGNLGLWRQPFRGYRPWQWPLIDDGVRRFRARAVEIDKGLDRRIMTFLGFSPAARAAIHKSVAQLLGPGDIETISFRQFVMESGRGLRNRDRPMDTASVARIAAARIGQWLEAGVLIGQDVLVDGPHLVRRFPSLLRGNATGLADLNRTAVLVSPPAASRIKASVQPYRFRRTNWLSRPAWFWSDIAVSGRISEVSDPFATPELSAEFCEDLSRFAPAHACRQFASGLESPFRRRYVLNHESPWAKRLRRNLRGPEDFIAVRYEPALRFAS